ncbi:FimB/Mfa2 family fimbrial subunit [uncultured Bacteroides sp.]|uniref:FimB/Mfa2 family fimbrial subunit n=1 Tax=uncultured Bacteroides sp. TaxID=162156 RepID=UPI0026376545|nr:FimB/Mfa2 family fimbrial subunit [uncultured Bacteroides sp.]
MALLVLVLPSSCIKEDFDDCDNVTIYFQYLADGDTDVLYQYMKKIDLYVFDENGHIMGVGHYNEDDLKTFSVKPSFKLTPGRTYKVVAVGNAYEHTEVTNLTTETEFNKIYLQHPAWGSGEEVDGHDHNYIGQKEFLIPTGEFTVYRDTVTLYSAHINVEVEINGLPAPENVRAGEDMPYKLMFEQSNAQTDFEGNVNEADDAKGTCYPDLIYDYERNCYRTDNLCLFRMNNPEGSIHELYCGHELVLVNAQTGEEMVRGDVYNYIKAHEDDFDLTLEEATLPISINFTETVVEIKLPQWYIEDIKPGWN